MNLACSECRGACCSSLTLPMPADREAAIWIQLRGRREGNTVRLAIPCRELTPCGMCGIEEIKPHACRVYPVGGPQCIAAIRSERPKDAARLIALARQCQET